jgi:hypothetical protein
LPWIPPCQKGRRVSGLSESPNLKNQMIKATGVAPLG